MMLQLQRHQLDVRYTSGKAIPVADALSRAQLPTTADADDRMNSDIEVMVHAITSSLPMSETRRDELKEQQLKMKNCKLSETLSFQDGQIISRQSHL